MRRSVWTGCRSTPCRGARPPAGAAEAVAARAARRRFRTVVREQADGGWTVAAEKGYLKETGNLLFHFALLAVLVGVGFGHWYGWHGDRILVAGADQGFCDSVAQYDDSTLGPRVAAADLPTFCLQADQLRRRPTRPPASRRRSGPRWR